MSDRSPTWETETTCFHGKSQKVSDTTAANDTACIVSRGKTTAVWNSWIIMSLLWLRESYWSCRGLHHWLLYRGRGQMRQAVDSSARGKFWKPWDRWGGVVLLSLKFLSPPSQTSPSHLALQQLQAQNSRKPQAPNANPLPKPRVTSWPVTWSPC